MKTITYNPETHVLVPREPTRAMCSAALAFDNNKPLNDWGMIVPNTYEETYSAMLSAAQQPEPNHNWCAGCSPDNCSGCGAEPVDSEPAMWVMKHIRSGDLAQAKPNQKALHPRMWSQAHLYTTPQPDRVAELEAALKVARDGIDEFLVANDPTEFGCACDLSVGYLCGPCHADKLRAELAEKDEVIAEAGEMLAMRDRQLAELEKLRAELAEKDEVIAELEEENTALVKTIQRDTLTSLRQLAALKAELREICAAIDDPACDLTLTAAECIKKLKAENESLRKDAERYRWLKNNDSPIGIYYNADFDDCYYIHEPDKEIDAAMSQGEQG